MNSSKTAYLNISTAPAEINQAFIRLFITVGICVYVFSRSYLTNGILLPNYSAIPLTYTILSIAFLAWSTRCVALKETNLERILFRSIVIFGDNLFLALGMHLGGSAGDPLFFIFLWVTFGNGVRYGVRYLMLSGILSFVFFGLVIYYTPTWHSQDVIVKALGLLCALLILPIYLMKLLSKLTEALNTAQEANRIKQMFIANMNHELRTPLNSIIQLTQLLKSYEIKEEGGRMLRMIGSSANALLDVVNQVLDVSKIESGEYNLVETNFDLGQVIRETYYIISPQCYKKDLRFLVSIDPGISKCYFGAPEQLKQILVNLLGNATKFTDSGRIALIVKVDEITDSKHKIRFLVQDTGIGVPAEFQSDIFKPFAQADPSITRRFGGTGLGVTITRQFVSAMNGEITLESEVGSGSCFTVTIPLQTVRQGTGEYFKPLGNLAIYPLYPSIDDQNFLALCKAYQVEVHTEHDTYNKYIDIQSNKVGDKTGALLLNAHRDLTPVVNLENIGRYSMPVICFTDSSESLKELAGVFIPLVNIDDTRMVYRALQIAAEYTSDEGKSNSLLETAPKKLDVLVAEDDITLQYINKTLFAKMGHNITVVDNGSEAVEHLLENHYDVAILDMHMPELSGLEAAQVYYSAVIEDRTPLILLTADNTDAAITQAREVGFSQILTKPVLPTDLLKSIYELLDLDFHTIETKPPVINEKQDGAASSPSETLINANPIHSLLGTTTVLQVQQIMEHYNEDVIARVSELSDAVTSKNYAKYRDLLHALLGSSETVGATSFAGLVRQSQRLSAEDLTTELASILCGDLISIHKSTLKMTNQVILDYSDKQIQGPV